MPDTAPQILTFDVGSSSVRTLLFDAQGDAVEGIGAHRPYTFDRTPDGGVQIDADRLSELCIGLLSDTCLQLRARGLRPAAVACDTFWHSVMGVDGGGRPATALLHLLDTRSEAAAAELRKRIDNRSQHTRTGCMLHPSYPPAKMLWLSEVHAEAFGRVARWMTIGEYLALKLFGKTATSTCMISAGGLWDQNRQDYDEEMLSVLPVRREQFVAPESMDQTVSGLRQEFREKLAELDGIPWYPALGDGACDSIGSGCGRSNSFALMVGTTGALRVTLERDRVEIPDGLWCYRLDRKRAVMGGAISSGGEVFAWINRTLRLPDPIETERQIAAMTPGAHGLTMLPYFSGERSTGWRSDARAAVTGMCAATTAVEILRVSLEAVALQFRNIYDILEQAAGRPERVVASGGALLHSAAWSGMMADALSRPVIACMEAEATARGAALLAMERMGVIADATAIVARMGETYQPVPEHEAMYRAELLRQRRLYEELYGR